MIKPRQEWQIYAELYEKEIKRLNDYIKAMYKKQVAYFFMGLATGVVSSLILAMWVMK